MKDLVRELQGDGANDNVLRDEGDGGRIENIRQDSIEEHSSILEVRQFIQSDLQPKNLNIGQQNKHIEGTNEYKQKVAQLRAKGEYGPSRLMITQDQAQGLINKYCATGKLFYSNKKGRFLNLQELILDNTTVVGEVVNNKTGEAVKTAIFKIHYGNKGAHIVPDYPSKKE